MSKLSEKVEELLQRYDATEEATIAALRNAEDLADKFSDIKPKIDIASAERFYGLPVVLQEPKDRS